MKKSLTLIVTAAMLLFALLTIFLPHTISMNMIAPIKKDFDKFANNDCKFKADQYLFSFAPYSYVEYGGDNFDVNYNKIDTAHVVINYVGLGNITSVNYYYNGNFICDLVD